MVPALAIVTVLTWGVWIPLAQAVGGIEQRTRTLYVTIGNLALSSAALLIGGGHLSAGWRDFWLPFGGGVVWTLGSYCAFRATTTIGLARAAGTWTPLNIIVAFVWGATVFSELSRFGAGDDAAVALAIAMVFAGVRLIVSSQDPGADGVTGFSGFLWAVGAGLLWGTYFIPAQWADIPARVADLPLAIGMLAGGLALALPAGRALRLPLRSTGIETAAGVLFGVGNLALLALVSRIGTGAGFTIAQLSLLVNAAIGIWVFKVPRPGTASARAALTGVVLAGIGGCVIGVVR